jgi:hypothetical protein
VLREHRPWVQTPEASRQETCGYLTVNVPAVTATPRRANGYLVPRLTIGASLTAICFGGVAVTNALRPGIGGSAVWTPAAVAVLCAVLVIVLWIRARANRA